MSYSHKAAIIVPSAVARITQIEPNQAISDCFRDNEVPVRPAKVANKESGT